MSSGYPTGQDTRRRRRKTSLPGITRLLDYLVLVMLLLVPVGGIWVFGGNRFWVMGPLILLCLLVALAFVFRFFLSTYRYDLVLPAGGLTGLLFLGYLAAIIGFAQVRYEALQETFRYVSYVLAFWMWVNLLRFNSRWKWALVCLMLSVSVMAWYAMIQEAQGTKMVLMTQRPDDYGMRASGAYICPNHFANLLEMMIPACLGLVFARGIGLPVKLFAGYTALVSLPPLYLTESRSGWIGLMTGLVVLAVTMALRKGFKKFILASVIAPLLVLSAGAAVWMLSPRVQARVEKAVRGDIRVDLWKDSLEIVKESPWWGSGLGSYRQMYPHFRNHLPLAHDPEFAHNDYIQFAGEIGVMGLALAAIMVILIVARAIKAVRADQDGSVAPLMAGMLGMMAGALAHAVFDFNFHIFGNVHVFVFIAGALLAATYQKELDTCIKVNTGIGRWTGILLVIITGGLSLYYSTMLVSYFHEISGESRIRTGHWEQAKDDFRKSIAWAPGNWRSHMGLAHVLRTQSFWMRNPAIRGPWIEEAMENYDIAGRQNPWAADIWFGMGSLHKMKGDQEAALAMRRKAVEQVPRRTFYMNALGHQLRDMGQFEEALKVFRESYAVDQNVIAQRNVAMMQRRIQASASENKTE